MCVCTVCVFKVKKGMVTLDLFWSVFRQNFFAFLCGTASWRGKGPPWLQDLERFRAVGCWHLVVALPIDRTTLRYWPVCWKAHVSLYFEWSTGLCCMYSTSVNQETPLAKHTMAVLVLLHACVSHICCFTPSGPADIMYPCLDSDIYFFWTWLL